MIFTPAYVDGVDLELLFNSKTSVLDCLPRVSPRGGFSFGLLVCLFFSFWNETLIIM